jgi:glycosyltransferase involved in cell wall biosynthesis
MKILFLSKYGRLGASSRLRTLQYIPFLAQFEIAATVSPFISDNQLRLKYLGENYDYASLCRSYLHRTVDLLKSKHFDLVVIEKESLPWLPASFEKFLLRNVPYVLDYDDAVFHNYDMHSSKIVRFFLGRRLDRLMRSAKLVIAGNTYLADRAYKSGASWVEHVPTVVDIRRYALKAGSPTRSMIPRVVWIGSPATVHYLELVREALCELAASVPFVLRIIGAPAPAISGVEIESFEWSEASEAERIAECDIGIMPLLDTPWEQGKCGYKLIQYMACGLPVVASSVGVNSDIVLPHHNGFLASNANDWISALSAMLWDEKMRRQFGLHGRSLVESRYSLQIQAPRVASLLIQAANSGANKF